MSDADAMTKPGTTKPALLKGVPTSDSAPMQTLLKMSNICNPIVLSTVVLLLAMLLVNGLVVHYEPVNPMNVFKDTEGNSIAADRTTGGLLHVATTTKTDLDFAGLFASAEDDLHECKESIQNVQYVADSMEVDANVEGMVFVSDLPVANSTDTEDALFLRTSISDLLVYETGAYKVLDERWDARKASLPVGVAGSRRRLTAGGPGGSASGRRQLGAPQACETTENGDVPANQPCVYSNMDAFYAAGNKLCSFTGLEDVLEKWLQDEGKVDDADRTVNIKAKLIRYHKGGLQQNGEWKSAGGLRCKALNEDNREACWEKTVDYFEQTKMKFSTNVGEYVASSGTDIICNTEEQPFGTSDNPGTLDDTINDWVKNDYIALKCDDANIRDENAWKIQRGSRIRSKLTRRCPPPSSDVCKPWCSGYCDDILDNNGNIQAWCPTACSTKFEKCQGCTHPGICVTGVTAS